MSKTITNSKYFFRQFWMAFLLCCCSVILFAQNGSPSSGGAKGIAMGNSGVAFSDINALFSNQAGLVGVENLEFTIFGEQRFFLSELQMVRAGVAIPSNSGTFGLSLEYFGFDQYNEQKIGLCYARKLSPKFALSGQVDYFNTRIAEYGNQGTLTFELGAQYTILKNLVIGTHIYSPIEVKLNEDYSIPSLYRLGLAYYPSSKVLISAEVEKDLDYAAVFRVGLEYVAAEGFFLRIGAASNPSLFSFGLGYHKKQLKIDVGTAYHLDLGFMPALSAAYRLDK